MTDLPAGLALALAILVLGAMMLDRARTDRVVLPRAQWSCARTRGTFDARRDPSPDGGRPVTRLVASSACTAWEHR